MAWKSIVPDNTDIDPKEDLKSAVSYGSFRLGKKAVYMGGREYILLSAVQQVKLYSSRLSSHGCCGLGVPVWYVLLYYGGEKPLKLLTETREKAENVLSAITSRNPEIEVVE